MKKNNNKQNTNGEEQLCKIFWRTKKTKENNNKKNTWDLYNYRTDQTNPSPVIQTQDGMHLTFIYLQKGINSSKGESADLIFGRQFQVSWMMTPNQDKSEIWCDCGSGGKIDFIYESKCPFLQRSQFPLSIRPTLAESNFCKRLVLADVFTLLSAGAANNMTDSGIPSACASF